MLKLLISVSINKLLLFFLKQNVPNLVRPATLTTHAVSHVLTDIYYKMAYVYRDVSQGSTKPAVHFVKVGVGIYELELFAVFPPCIIPW